MLITSPNQSPKPGDEFLDLKRFSEIVVSSHIESLDTFVKSVSSRQENDRSADASFTEVSDDTDAILSWKHGVEDKGVEFLGRGKIKGSVAMMLNV